MLPKGRLMLRLPLFVEMFPVPSLLANEVAADRSCLHVVAENGVLAPPQLC